MTEFGGRQIFDWGVGEGVASAFDVAFQELHESAV